MSALSKRAAGIESSGIRRIFELVSSMDDPINLSIGQADFDVPEPVKSAAIEAIQAGHNRYTVTQGLPELNEAILDRLADRHGYKGRDGMVTSGVSGGLMLGFMAALDPGDHVLIPDPYFTMYGVLAEMVSAQWGSYDLYPESVLTEQSLEAGLTDRTRAILINSPSNPTGRTLTAAELDAVEAVSARHELLVISDEIYDEFVYDGPHESAVGHVSEERLLVLGGFSKTYGMPGWRMGWAAGPAEILDAMRKMQQFSFVCAPSIAQHACLTALQTDMSKELAEYQRKRDRIIDGIADLYDVAIPGGSFYMFPRLPAGAGMEAFMEKCLERKLLVVPGSAFSSKATHFRISFAASERILDRGVEALRAVAEEFGAG